MSLQLQYEKNSMRKSHRIEIPLKVYIQNNIYNVIDWSMTGLSISTKANSFIVDDFYDAVLLLGLKDATISIKIKLKCVYGKENRYGYEFNELSDKNRKMLRRYLEFYLDGKWDDMDELIGVYSEPDIGTALKEPVKLNDLEKSSLQKSFLRKSLSAVVFSFLLLLLIGATLFYNLRYTYEGVGIVEGNYKNIYAKHKGVLEKIYVKTGDRVKKDDILADINSEKILQQIKLLETIKKTKLKKIEADFLYQNATTAPQQDNSELLNLKKQMVNEAYKNYQNAKIQFNNHLITKTELLYFKNKFLESKESYALYKEKSTNQKNSPALVPKIYNIEETNLKIKNKKRLLEEYRIFSPQDGKVYEITAEVSDFISRDKPLLVLWTDNKPKIIASLEDKEAINIKIGSSVEIIDSLGEYKFKGIVKHITNKVLNMDIKTEGVSNLVYVEIEPEDKSKVLPPKSVVKVLFKRTSWFEL
jgi:multidrug resistance efflux pump